MEILINELSFCGQFASVDEFVEQALPPLIFVLKDINSSKDQLLKKDDFYLSSVTKQNTLYDVFVGTFSRQYDEIRRVKTLLVKLFEDPYWEKDQKHSVNSKYIYNQNDVWGSSLAESCERDKVILSSMFANFNNRLLAVFKDAAVVSIDNLFDKGHYIELCWQRQTITFEEYCVTKFKGNKLDFSLIDTREGFNLIEQKDQNVFFDGFRKFSELTWPQISLDDGLDFKDFNNKNYFKSISHQIKKFRITQKYRCFGYVNQGVFYALMFDLDHKLSDKG